MTMLLLAILAASLVGSLHCAGMCGPFLAFVVGAGPRTFADSAPGAHGGTRVEASAFALQCAYHAARGAGYALLGAAAGAAGHLVDLAGALTGLQPLAAGLAGLTLVALGAAALCRLTGWGGARLPAPLARLSRVGLPARVAGLLRRAQVRALRLPPTSRALAIGATTTLLPCGWLYAFAVTAAGTGAPLPGLLVMAVFWLGTLPVLVSLGALVRGTTRRFGPRWQAIGGIALVGLGLCTLMGRVRLEPRSLARTVEAGRSATAVPALGERPACCAGALDEPSAEDGESDGPR
jgi:sulfite exporter TauE/SafE